MSIGSQVRIWRTNHTHDTQAEVAEAAKCSREAVSRIERGLMTPSVDLLCRLADALGVSLDYLTERGIWAPKYGCTMSDHTD
jgi:transcriptional regulator with XRE-family HTH domain